VENSLSMIFQSHRAAVHPGLSNRKKAARYSGLGIPVKDPTKSPANRTKLKGPPEANSAGDLPAYTCAVLPIFGGTDEIRRGGRPARDRSGSQGRRTSERCSATGLDARLESQIVDSGRELIWEGSFLSLCLSLSLSLFFSLSLSLCSASLTILISYSLLLYLPSLVSPVHTSR